MRRDSLRTIIKSGAVALVVMGGCEDCQLRLHSGALEEVFGGSEGASAGSTAVEETGRASNSEGGTTMGESATVTTASSSTTEQSGPEWGVTSEDGTVGMSEPSGSTDFVPEDYCGDGIVNEGEECDDGDQTDFDGCSRDCLTPRYVFVTSAMYGGDLNEKTADQLCNDAAEMRLPGVYRAWVAGAASGDDPVDWFEGFNGSMRLYITPCLDAVTSGVDFPGQLFHPIDCDESGAAVSASPVWTSVDGGGEQPWTGDNCKGWTTRKPVYRGDIGRVGATDGQWIDAGWQYCSDVAHLYCFQVGD